LHTIALEEPRADEVVEQERTGIEALGVTANTVMPTVRGTFEIPLKLALIATRRVAAEVGVYFTLHDPAESLHVRLENKPVPLLDHVIVPGDDDAVSAEQTVGTPTEVLTGLHATSRVPRVMLEEAQKVEGGVPTLLSFTKTEKLVAFPIAPVEKAIEFCPLMGVPQVEPVYH
jgi:hypothetical protein